MSYDLVHLTVRKIQYFPANSTSEYKVGHQGTGVLCLKGHNQKCQLSGSLQGRPIVVPATSCSLIHLEWCFRAIFGAGERRHVVEETIPGWAGEPRHSSHYASKAEFTNCWPTGYPQKGLYRLQGELNSVLHLN